MAHDDIEIQAASRWWTGVATGAAALAAAGLVLVGASAHPGTALTTSTPTTVAVASTS